MKKKTARNEPRFDEYEMNKLFCAITKPETRGSYKWIQLVITK